MFDSVQQFGDNTVFADNTEKDELQKIQEKGGLGTLIHFDVVTITTRFNHSQKFKNVFIWHSSNFIKVFDENYKLSAIYPTLNVLEVLDV